MKAPKCWTCQGRHWSTQPCVTKDRALLQDFANNVTPVTKTLPIIHGGVTKVGDLPHTSEEVMPAGHSARPQINSAGGGRGKGRPKKYGSNAERQRAYRERKPIS